MNAVFRDVTAAYRGMRDEFLGDRGLERCVYNIIQRLIETKDIADALHTSTFFSPQMIDPADEVIINENMLSELAGNELRVFASLADVKARLNGRGGTVGR